MSTGWPPIRYRFSIQVKEKTAPFLKSGAVFQNGSRVEPFWLHFFFSAELFYTVRGRATSSPLNQLSKVHSQKNLINASLEMGQHFHISTAPLQ